MNKRVWIGDAGVKNFNFQFLFYHRFSLDMPIQWAKRELKVRKKSVDRRSLSKNFNFQLFVLFFFFIDFCLICPYNGPSESEKIVD